MRAVDGEGWMHIWVLRFPALIVTVLLLGAVPLDAVRAEEGDELAQLLNEVDRLYSRGRYLDALPLAQRAVSHARKLHGEKHLQFAAATIWLAELYRVKGRFAEAEPLLNAGLSVRKTALGHEHPLVASTLYNLATLY